MISRKDVLPSNFYMRTNIIIPQRDRNICWQILFYHKFRRSLRSSFCKTLFCPHVALCALTC